MPDILPKNNFVKDHTVGQRNYFTVLYKLPLVAVLSTTVNNNVIFRTL